MSRLSDILTQIQQAGGGTAANVASPTAAAGGADFVFQKLSEAAGINPDAYEQLKQLFDSIFKTEMETLKQEGKIRALDAHSRDIALRGATTESAIRARTAGTVAREQARAQRQIAVRQAPDAAGIAAQLEKSQLEVRAAEDMKRSKIRDLSPAQLDRLKARYEPHAAKSSAIASLLGKVEIERDETVSSLAGQSVGKAEKLGLLKGVDATSFSDEVLAQVEASGKRVSPSVMEEIVKKIKPTSALPGFLAKGSLSRKLAIPAAVIAGLFALRGAGQKDTEQGLPPLLQAQLQIEAFKAQSAGQKTNKDLVNAMRVISLIKNLQGMTQAAQVPAPVSLI